MQKHQYTLLLMRDDGVNHNIRFCANTLRLLITLCIIIPIALVASIYVASQYWQDAAITAHDNEELRHELHVYQQELQKYATIQRLVKDYEHEASPILIASQAVPAPVPYAVEESPKPEELARDEAQTTSEEKTGEVGGAEDGTAKECAGNDSAVAMADSPKGAVEGVLEAETGEARELSVPSHGTELVADDVSQANVQNNTQAVDTSPSKATVEDILQQQNRPQSPDSDGFTTVVDQKAKLTDLAIRESNGQVKTSFQLVNTTSTAIAGHIYIAIQGHDKRLHPITISEKFTAFRIVRFRDYDLNFALPSGFSAADVDKVIITAKTRDGEVFYCNGFTLE